MKALFTLSLLLAVATFANAQTPSDSELESKISDVVEPFMQAEILQSVAIGIIDGNRELFLGFGKISADNPIAPERNTVFEIGSISKVFTGILLGDAIERGIVQADQPVDDLLPNGIVMPTFAQNAAEKITLTQLSTHSSGLPRLPDNLDPADPDNPYADYSADRLFDFLKGHELKSKPGTTDEYSNLGAGLLGHLIAKKQDRDYETLLTQRITSPLAMNDTSLTLSDSQRQRLAIGHDTYLDPASNWDFTSLAGAGGIRSTASDMLIFARANLSPPENETGRAIERAWKQQRPALGFGGLAMGFGWMINPRSETHWHNGGTGGYHSMLFVDRKKGRALIVLSNTSATDVDGLASRIMTVLDGKKVRPPRNLKKKTRRETVDVAEDVKAKLIGKYQLAPGVIMEIARSKSDASQLTVQLTGQSALPIFPTSDTRWFLKVVDAQLEFTLGSDGECESLTLVQNGRQTAKRIAQ